MSLSILETGNHGENHIYVNVDLGVTKNESTTMIRRLIKVG